MPNFNINLEAFNKHFLDPEYSRTVSKSSLKCLKHRFVSRCYGFCSPLGKNPGCAHDPMCYIDLRHSTV